MGGKCRAVITLLRPAVMMGQCGQVVPVVAPAGHHPWGRARVRWVEGDPLREIVRGKGRLAVKGD